MKKTHKLLLVDDETDLLEMLAETLPDLLGPKWGEFEVDLAENGAKALEMTDKKQYDVVVSDLSMPECSGTEFIKKVRSQLGLNRETPFLIMSGRISQHETEKIPNVFYLSKPFHLNRIQRLISMILASGTDNTQGATETVAEGAG